MSKKSVFAPTIVLVSLCLIASLLLAVTYQITLPVIEGIQIKKANVSRAEVLPEADDFSKVDGLTLYDGVIEVFKANNGAGYVITSKAKGFGGDVTVMTGIGSDGRITSIKVTDASNETPGLGSKATLPDYTDQYKGAEKVTSEKADGSATYIQGVTGASFTSRAVFSCVSSAVMQYQDLGGK